MTERRRIWVTGATGFLGKALVRRLAVSGHHVCAIGRRARQMDWHLSKDAPGSVEPIALDLEDAARTKALFAEARCDAVIHLAADVAKGGDQAREASLSHGRIARSVLDALPDGFSGKVVFASSMTVLGTPRAAAGPLPVKDGAPRSPGDFLYAQGKAAMEEAAESRPDLDVWILRLPGLFSEERRDGAIGKLIEAAARQSVLPVLFDPNKPFQWDVLHVEDAATAFCRTIASPERGPLILNVSYGEALDLLEVARRIARLDVSGGASKWLPSVGLPPLQLDIAGAKRLLPPWPPASLDVRLKAMFDATRRALGLAEETPEGAG